MNQEKTSQGKDDAYEDRNLAVLAFLKSQHEIRQKITPTPTQYPVEFGYSEDEDTSREWVIVWIDSPDGQMSWHMRRELVQRAPWLEKKDYEWDGHSREEKNQRLKTYIERE